MNSSSKVEKLEQETSKLTCSRMTCRGFKTNSSILISNSTTALKNQKIFQDGFISLNVKMHIKQMNYRCKEVLCSEIPAPASSRFVHPRLGLPCLLS